MKPFKLFVVLSLCPLLSFARDYQDYPDYNAEISYHRGHIVKNSNHLWVARIRSKGKKPESHRIHWQRVKLEKVDNWSRRTFYLAGAVVHYSDKHYFAKSLTFFRPGGWLGRRSWESFSHPAIGLDLPVVDWEESRQQLEGIDANFNGLRDDYEAYVIMKSPSERARNIGMRAGALYTSVINLIGTDVSEMTHEDAASMMNELINMRRCSRTLRRGNQNFQGFHPGFFNTTDRMLGSFQGQYKLYDLLGDHFRPTVEEDPCEQFDI
ncbi:hypothetical protein KUV89_05615 [Marinobacter hydrocarbonoclasticus]|nr:hypothetical protein [Marinobacter nauticus]